MKGVIFVLNCFAVFYSFAFFILRGGELAYLLDTPAYLTSVALGYFTIVKLGRLPLFVFLLVWNLCMIWIFDVHFYNFPTTFPVEELDGKTVVITGANSGTGLATAFKVAEYGGTVYLGCRSKRKCLDAAASINGNNFPGSAIVVDPVLDLSSLDATEKFAKALSSVKIDILLNNAGFAPKNGATQTVDGFEPAVGSMHYVSTNFHLFFPLHWFYMIHAGSYVSYKTTPGTTAESKAKDPGSKCCLRDPLRLSMV